MNKEELEKMFDKQDFTETSGLYEDRETYVSLEKVKVYIFETLISEVLKNIIPERLNIFGNYDNDYNVCLDDIKQKAKELYNIDL